MTVPTTSLPVRGNSRRRFARLLTATVFTVGVVLIASRSETQLAAAADPPVGKAKETLVGGKAHFADWPKDKKPDAVIVLSGQSFGFLQPCGCSRPQTGGLERRATLIEQLKAKGWPVAGVDLGDVMPEKSLLADQGRLKYVATMNSLREMGYLAVGMGKTELSSNFFRLVADYAFQKEQRPFTLAGNIVGKNGNVETPREQMFPPGQGKRPTVELIEVGEVGTVKVGTAGVVGNAVRAENKKHKWDESFDFPDAKSTIETAIKALAKQKSQLNILIFQGPRDDAEKVAKDFPQFRVILCQTDDGAPAPLQAQEVMHKDGTKTLIVQVGHKGQNVGVLGAFKKPDGSFELKYQLVPLGEEFITPGTEAEALKNNKTLQILEDYAKAVKGEAGKFLKDYPRVAHPAKIHAAGLKPPVNLTYVGSAECKACHADEFKKWEKTPHGHAMDTLEKIAKRPSLRQFDADCVQCHTVGFHYQDGYIDDVKTKHLRDVGCENCHGPGSGHVAKPNDKDLLAFMSPWKKEGAAKLPDAVFMDKMAKLARIERGKVAIAPAQQMLINGVETMCMKCHDAEADPNFDIYKSWPKVDHSGLAPKGGWPNKKK